VTRCTFTWKGPAPCPKHPGTGKHQCKRQQPHDPHQPYKYHQCRCDAIKMVTLKVTMQQSIGIA
jgi:hypothetical protein